MNRKRFNVLGSFAVLALLASCESGTVSVSADSSSGASSQASSSEVPTSSESSSSSSSSSLKDYTPDDGKSYTLTDEMIKNVSDNNITFNGRFILYEAPKDSDYLTNDPCPYGITVKMDDGLYYAGSALQDHSTNKLGVHETTIFPNSEGYACIASSVNLPNQNYDVCDFKMADSAYKNELGELKADYFQATTTTSEPGTASLLLKKLRPQWSHLTTCAMSTTT
ncbi:MAG: hypothetical protein WCR56_06555 [Bacilli bacterium]|jgi:hypothetical protein